MAQNVREGEALNEATLKPYLAAQNLIEHVDSELEVSQFSTGFSNLTYLLQIEDKEYILRRPPFGAIKRGHDMGREYKVLSRLHKGFAKSPVAYAYTEDIDILGAPFYIMERVHGIILSRPEAEKRKVSVTQFPIIANQWMDTFVALHQVDYNMIGLGDLGRPEGYVDRQVLNWGKQYLKAATEEIEEAEKIMAWMEEHKPKSYDHSLIHNDYKYDNVVFADDSYQKINAVLDWEMCTLGDPLMDLGTSVAYWSMMSDGDFIVQGFPSPTTMPGNPGRTDLIEMYAQKSGRPINHMVFYYVYGTFKIAVIIQQIYYRYHHGMTQDKRFANLNQATKLFMMMAWQAIQKNRIENLF